MDKQTAADMVMSTMNEANPKAKQFGLILTGVIVQVIAWAITKCGEKLIENHEKKQKLKMFQVMSLRRQVRNEMAAQGLDRVQFLNHGDDIVKATLKNLDLVSTDDLKSLVNNG
jgi:hypothetical protein